MPQQRPDGVRKRHPGAVVETTLIVGLAALAVIYGGGAVFSVFLGIGRMMAAVLSVAAP
ncbi:MAG: hypothetical protein ACXW3O_00455 [Brevundimonas sp.]